MREAFLLLSLAFLESHPGFPRLEQQGLCLHAGCKFARALAETWLGLDTGRYMDAACTGGLGSRFQPGQGCQDPTKVSSALTLTWHMPIAPHSAAPASGPYATTMLSPPQSCRMWPGRCHGRQVKQLLCVSSSTITLLSDAFLPSPPSSWHLCALRGSHQRWERKGCANARPALQRHARPCVGGGHSRAFLSAPLRPQSCWHCSVSVLSHHAVYPSVGIPSRVKGEKLGKEAALFLLRPPFTLQSPKPRSSPACQCWGRDILHHPPLHPIAHGPGKRAGTPPAPHARI